MGHAPGAVLMHPPLQNVNVALTPFGESATVTRNFRNLMIKTKFFVPVMVSILVASSFSGLCASPIRALLITGGCCHDYAQQKDILKNGIMERANVVIEQIHTDDTSTHPPLAILGNPDYAKGFDIVIHDECAADVSDQAKVEGVLKP